MVRLAGIEPTLGAYRLHPPTDAYFHISPWLKKVG